MTNGNTKAIWAAVAALGVGGGGVGLVGNHADLQGQMDTLELRVIENVRRLEVEIADIRAENADEERRITALVTLSATEGADRARRIRADLDDKLDEVFRIALLNSCRLE